MQQRDGQPPGDGELPSIGEIIEQHPDMPLKQIAALYEQRRATRPTNGAILERANSLANRAVWTLDLQRDRLRAPEALSSDFFRFWSDLEFFILTLSHLRRAAELARRVDAVKSRIRVGIRDFDAAVPDLRMMRDIIEHIDEYAFDSRVRKHDQISRRQLQVGVWDGTIFHWLGVQLNIDTAFDAGRKLYLCIHELLTAEKSPQGRT